MRVTLLEAESGINDAPRAAIYFPTTLEILDRLGLLEDAEAIGLPSTRFALRTPETGEVIYNDLRNTLPPGTKYDHNLHMGQHILAGVVLHTSIGCPMHKCCGTTGWLVSQKTGRA